MNAKKTLLNETLIWFLIAMILANIAGSMYMDLLPLYLQELNASVAQVGLFFTLSAIIPLALQILGGWISDSLGRLRSIAIGSLAGVLSYVGLVLAPSWEWLLLAQGLGAVTSALVAPSYGAFIAESSSEENRARVFGVVETLYSVVGIVGPPLGAWLVQLRGFKPMLFVAGILYLSATIIRVRMARNARRQNPAPASALTLDSLRGNLRSLLILLVSGGLLTWLFLTDGVRDIFFRMSFTFFPVYLKSVGGLTIQQIGWLSASLSTAIMATNLLGGWLADRKGEHVAISLGFLLDGISMLIFLRASTFPLFLLSWVLAGVGIGMMSPAYSSLMSKALPERLRGTGFGLLHSSLGVFSLPAPSIGAYLYEKFSPRAPFMLTTVISFLTILPAWFKFRPQKAAPAPLAVEGQTAPVSEQG